MKLDVTQVLVDASHKMKFQRKTKCQLIHSLLLQRMLKLMNLLLLKVKVMLKEKKLLQKVKRRAHMLNHHFHHKKDGTPKPMPVESQETQPDATQVLVAASLKMLFQLINKCQLIHLLNQRKLRLLLKPKLHQDHHNKDGTLRPTPVGNQEMKPDATQVLEAASHKMKLHQKTKCQLIHSQFQRRKRKSELTKLCQDYKYSKT